MAEYDPFRFIAYPAVTQGNSVPLRNAVAQVYAPEDTAFSTPLAITDWQGVPMATLVSSPQGVYPAFRCEGHPQVIAKSGEYKTELESKYGVMLQVGIDPETVAAAIAASTTAQGAATAAAASAALAAQAAAAADGGTPTWDAVQNKPSTFAPSDHTQPVSTLRNGSAALATAVASLLSAADAQAARAAIGAGTGNGTSNLTLGASGTTAMPGNKVFKAGEVTVAPTGPITATDVQSAFDQVATALGTGGGGGAGGVYPWRYSAGGYPALPASKPAGYFMVQALGPTFPTTLPSWVGLAANQLPLAYSKVAVA